MRYLRYLAGAALIVSLWVASSCAPTNRPDLAQPSSADASPQQVQQPPRASSSSEPLGGGSGWRRVFSDEFNASALATTNWTRCYWWDDDGCTNLSNRNLNWYTRNNISVADGMLVLTAREEPTSGTGGRSYPYTSGIVTTGRYYSERGQSDRFGFTYGFVEVRARIPSGRGLWPAIWLLPSTQRALPEIDIMEVLGHRPNVLEMHFHYVGENGRRRKANKRVTVGDLSRNFHVYGLEWSPNAIVWYLDGVERMRFTDASAIPHESMYLLINLAVGGTWPGAPDANTRFPADFLIDYVRIWQRDQ